MTYKRNIFILFIVSTIISVSLYIYYNQKNDLVTKPSPTPSPPTPSPPTPSPPTPSPPTPSPPTPSPTNPVVDDVGNFLEDHNKYRTKQGYPPLEWNNSLAEKAKIWSQHLVDTNNGQLQHGGLNDDNCVAGSCGQNLHAGDIKTAVSNWYNECPNYKGSYSEDSGHYSQLMWKGAKKLGCGVANGGQYGHVTTCMYDVAQINSGDYFKNNVPSVGSCN